MARIFGLIANRKIRLPELKEVDCELTRLSGVTGFKSGSIISPDRKVYFSYREKNNHKFNYLKDETENIYLIVGGVPIKNTKIISPQTILYSYKHQKLNELLDELDGFFYLALVDQEKERVILIKDRFGPNPLFYAKVKDGVLISNYASLLSFAANKGKRKENKEIVARFAVNHYGEIYGEGHTFYNNVREVKPATRLTICKSKISEENYWQLQSQSDYFESESEANIADGFTEILLRTAKNNYENIDDYAFTLSGGMDSGTLISLFKHLYNEKPPAVSITYKENVRANERALIEPIAAECAGKWHNIIPTKEEFIGDINDIYKKYDHPWVTATVYAQERLFRGFKENGYTTLISGSGGDHHMAGDYPHYLYYFAYLKYHGKLNLLEHEIAKWIEYHSEEPWIKTKKTVNDFFERCIDFTKNGKLKVNHDYLVGSGVLLNENYRNFHKFLVPFPSYGDYTRSYTMKELLRSAFPPALWSESIMAWNYDIHEVSPFWNRELFEYSWRIPHRYKIRNGTNKVMIRDITKGIVPDHIRKRKSKTGFNMPFDIWMYEEKFREKMNDVLLSRKFKDRGIYDMEKVKDLLKSHYTMKQNHGMQLWQMLNLELWFNSWID